MFEDDCDDEARIQLPVTINDEEQLQWFSLRNSITVRILFSFFS
jgi:hypothetical protein